MKYFLEVDEYYTEGNECSTDGNCGRNSREEDYIKVQDKYLNQLREFIRAKRP